MFTGIIESVGIVQQVLHEEDNLILWVKSPLSQTLTLGQSLAHNGICLTVEAVEDDKHRVTLVRETLLKTNASCIQEGSVLNIERCLELGARLDGHFLQGHVDTTATVLRVAPQNGSWVYEFGLATSEFEELYVEKGSIAVSGISLTVFEVRKQAFCVTIIPYTYAHTNASSWQVGDKVNVEFDVLGKYILKQRTIV